MYKALLIHNDNTPLKKTIEDQIVFKPTIDELNNSDIDKYISNEVIPKINEKEFDVIYIKDTLSENYIDFYGLILAYHIRLSNELNEKKLLPIVILSEVNSYTINKITPLGNILFTKNIFLVENTLCSVEKFDYLTIKSLTLEDYQNGFLNKIEIKPPKDYLSHHSITNEWAIYQWGQLLGVHTPSMEKNTQKISSMLYFKYLVNKYHLEDKTEKHNKLVEKSGNILLIDDKGVDGWNDILDKFISSNYTNVNPFTLEEKQEEKIYKDKDIGELQQFTKTKINECDPDIILLDLRLLEHIDNNQEKVLEISGIKLLKYIKKLNPSIQVIIFSASTDSLILDELYANGVLGYIKKDSPTNKYLASKNSLTKLDKLIKQGLDRKYLKVIWNIQQDILQLPFLTNNSNTSIFELRKNIASVFDVLNGNLPNAFVYAMLSIYKCIELINNYYVDDKNGIWKVGNKKGNRIDLLAGNKITSTRNKLLNVIKELNIDGMENTINDIVHKRNNIIHPNTQDENITTNNIIDWFEMVFDILTIVKSKS